ncbi:D-isomer specific 2-hydroxyacid dehydrogenase [Aspergillus bertholletiae]|uniref:D-isomer specific 2-hydroxyacid dehydrogenase n=1 Tax=Aspergillus bertholletiae TaxID=1226010 RepID=A0A5N7BIX1_9EURO|nr:D-isomer specific 2-hydroxyacid dehydrogenase [Aspergillus bertholletiae]
MAIGTELKVYVLDPYHPDAVELVQNIPGIQAILPGDPRMESWHSDADGLMVRSDSRLTEKDFAKAQSLRVVVKQGVGVDNIDLVAAKKRGIAVHNTPALNSESVAELSMALTLALTRRVSEIDRAVRGGATVIRSQTLSTSMFRKTVGVVGMGNIGKIVAQKWIGAFDCSIVAYDPFVAPDAWSGVDHMRAQTLDELLRVSDVVTLHVPLVENTRGLIGEHELDIMKESAFLVNCARGGVVDERALLRALNEKWIGGAALDTTEIEPPTLEVHGEFLKHENVIITPHIGGSTKENQSRNGMYVVETLVNVLHGREATGKLV